ncbi:MAG TPA: hypothetical protein DEA96_12290 [Leptospiraceae bacterium]|nr:hypothetical protein [Spirochaetaceae bacterium]HBS05740.1 hypothetical protein [Leptospiraceae bacterium]|tara:strand:- start:30 stop:662 length:633 start_codon:yes stop_codon:yes gene_type:complete
MSRLDRFKASFNGILELATVCLTSPADISVYIRSLQDRRTALLIYPAGAALSAVLAVWTISPTYHAFFFVPLFLSVLVVFAFFVTLSYLSGSLVDYFIQRVAANSRQAQSGSTREEAQAISIILLSYLPAIFLYPVAKSLSLFSFGVFLFYPLGLLIFVWCFLILHQSLIYLYELPPKLVWRALLRSSGVLFLFPFTALGFAVIVLSGLF